MLTRTVLLVLLTCASAPAAFAGGNSSVSTSPSSDGYIWESSDTENFMAQPKNPAPPPRITTTAPTNVPVQTPFFGFTTAQEFWAWLLQNRMMY